MRVHRTLLIDQSSNCCGFAILEAGLILEHGIFEPSIKPVSSGRRLREMYKDIKAKIKETQITEMVIEDIYYKGLQNVDHIEPLAGGATICQMAADLYSIKVYKVPPGTWKKAIGAKGKKDTIKKRVETIVCRFWGIPKYLIQTDDQSDALGMAACWKYMATELRNKKK